MKKPFVIGVLGGMGTYATIHFFEKYATAFPAEKEWDRPRILIDNNCTMPSRVRAILYNENRPRLVEEMTASVAHLLEAGATRLVLACNTSHLFLEDVYQNLPDAKNAVVDIIDACVNSLKANGVTDAYLLATEGTILSKVYNTRLEAAGITCTAPGESDFTKLRTCIEAVKQNAFPDEVRQVFLDLIKDAKSKHVILGCTELPVLAQRYAAELAQMDVTLYDPLDSALEILKADYAKSK